MRFLRGIGVGVLGLGLLIVVFIFGLLGFIYEYGLGQDYGLSIVKSFLLVLLIASFAIMVGGPLYYWVIEPIRDKYHSRQ
ncbi:MAG: hypothetical protein ACXACW_00855 [Candidatus Hodarchaeales archaeon]|jgi:hypothetical protein